MLAGRRQPEYLSELYCSSGLLSAHEVQQRCASIPGFIGILGSILTFEDPNVAAVVAKSLSQYVRPCSGKAGI